MNNGISSFAKNAAYVLICAVILFVTTGFAIIFFSGVGHLHSIFAYATEARVVEVALMIYIVELSVLTLGAMLLVLLHYPLRWWAIGLVASVIGLWYWWLVCSWEPQSAHFHKAFLLLLPLIPSVIFYACAVATWCQFVVHFRLHRPNPPLEPTATFSDK
jgi:hypothetical protein